MLVFIVIASVSINAILVSGDILQTPIPVLYLVGLLIVRPVVFMQVYLVTGEPLILWRRTAILTIIVLWMVTISSEYFKYKYWHILTIYFTLNAINLLAALHMIYFTMIELSNILNIGIFTIKTKDVNTLE